MNSKFGSIFCTNYCIDILSILYACICHLVSRLRACSLINLKLNSPHQPPLILSDTVTHARCFLNLETHLRPTLGSGLDQWSVLTYNNTHVLYLSNARFSFTNRPLSNTLQFPPTIIWSRGFVPSFHTFAAFSRTKPRLQVIVRGNWSVIWKWSIATRPSQPN